MRIRRWSLSLCFVVFLTAGCTPIHVHFKQEYTRLLVDPVDPSALTTDDANNMANSAISFMWFGTNAFHITDGESSILFDPFVSRYPMAHVVARRPMRPKADLIDHWVGQLQGPPPSHIFVSHSHFDHSLDAPGFAKALSATVVGSPSTRNIALGQDLPEDQFRLFSFGETLEIGQFKITAVESTHGRPLLGREPYPGHISAPVPGEAHAAAYRTGMSYSYIVEHPQISMILHGYGFVPVEAYEGRSVDYLFLTIAGRRDYGHFLAELTDIMDFDTVVPTHFDNFFRPLAKPLKAGQTVNFRKFVKAVEQRANGLRLQTFPIGEYVTLERVNAD